MFPARSPVDTVPDADRPPHDDGSATDTKVFPIPRSNCIRLSALAQSVRVLRICTEGKAAGIVLLSKEGPGSCRKHRFEPGTRIRQLSARGEFIRIESVRLQVHKESIKIAPAEARSTESEGEASSFVTSNRESRLLPLDAIFEKKADWQLFTITDGRLITGQNPVSTFTAQALLNFLAAEKAAWIPIEERQFRKGKEEV